MSAASPSSAGGLRPPDRSLAWPALALLGLVAVFLWKPIAGLGSGVYSPSDLTQRYPLLSVQSGPHRVANELLGDVVTEMEPWLRFNREELHRGRLPLINPYNGGGVPHLANAQSAVLSPFSLPHYFLSPKLALLSAALLKLLTAGAFMLLFLRELGLSGGAALAGAVGYAFCGHNVLLLGYPHAGAAALLPAILYFAERALARHERGLGLDRRSLAGLALACAACALAGQPEPLFFGALISAAYAAFRLVGRVLRAPERGRELRAVLPLAAGLAGAALCALALSAVALLPFLEYLGVSLLAEQRAGVQTPLMRELWPLYAYPNLLGNPSLAYYLYSGMPPINYEAANTGYLGALLSFAALVSCAFLRRHAAHRLFALVTVLWVLWAYDLWGLNRWLAGVPVLGLAPINRSQFVLALAASACAAFAIQGLADLQRRRLTAALALLVAAAAAILWFKIGAGHLVERAQDRAARMAGILFPVADMPLAAARHRAEVHFVFGLGVALLCGLALARGKRWRAACAALWVGCSFAQTGWLLRAYNPTIPEAEHFPATEAIRDLAAAVDGELLAIVGTEALPPSMNLPYKVPLLANYDGLWVARYDDLYRARFGAHSNWRTITQADRQSLQLFGARYVLTEPGWAPIDTLLSAVPWNPRSFLELLPFTFGVDVTQTFTVPTGSLSGIRLWLDTHGEEHDGLLAIRLRDAETFELLAEKAVQCRDLEAGPNGYAEVVLSFEPVPRTPERLFRLRIEGQELRSGSGVSVLARADMIDWQNQMLHDQERRWRRASRAEPLPRIDDRADAHHALASWRLFQGGGEVSGGLAFELSVAETPLEPVRAIGPYQLWRVPEASRYRLVGERIVVPSRAAARRELDHPDFDPQTMVVLEDPEVGVSYRDPPLARPPGRLEVIEEGARSATFYALLDEPAWLVTSRPWIPGWRAESEAGELETVCANEAFLAVALPAGEHNLVLSYEPASVRAGGWISLLGAGGLVALMRWRGPRRRSAAG